MNDPPVLDWDRHNVDHIAGHRVTPDDVAHVLADPQRIVGDAYTKRGEVRYAVIGSTADGRVLWVAYIYRRGRIRVVTARLAHRRELRDYGTGSHA